MIRGTLLLPVVALGACWGNLSLSPGAGAALWGHAGPQEGLLHALHAAVAITFAAWNPRFVTKYVLDGNSSVWIDPGHVVCSENLIPWASELKESVQDVLKRRDVQFWYALCDNGVQRSIVTQSPSGIKVTKEKQAQTLLQDTICSSVLNIGSDKVAVVLEDSYPPAFRPLWSTVHITDNGLEIQPAVRLISQTQLAVPLLIEPGHRIDVCLVVEKKSLRLDQLFPTHERGLFVGPALIREDGGYPLFSNAVRVHTIVPDGTMLFNTITIASTVFGLAFGQLLYILAYSRQELKAIRAEKNIISRIKAKIQALWYKEPIYG